MSFRNWPPGLIFLIHMTPLLAFPPLLVLIVHQYSPVKLPGYMWINAYLLSTPAVQVVNGVLHYLQEENEIEKLGARRIPQVPSYSPGGLDKILMSVKSLANGYPGMPFPLPIVTFHFHRTCGIRRRLRILEYKYQLDHQSPNTLE